MKASNYFQYTPRTLSFSLLICISVAVVVVQVRNQGWLQAWDLMAYDYLLNQTVEESGLNENIVIVGISEEDIQSRQEWPLSDQTLAQIIKRILAQSPNAIGIDIYRDMLIAPGTELLTEALRNRDNVLLVEKFSSNKSEMAIYPNQGLVNEHQIGFSDMLIDNDGVVRRGLLFLNNDERISYALSLRLASIFLANKNIQLRSDPKAPDHLMLGNVTYIPLEENDGGYVGFDASGYQYFLSYANEKPGFKIISLKELFGNKENLQFMRDKIVIVGVISDSVKDAFITPLNKGKNSDNLMPGVVLHAYATNQLINSALLDEKPLSTVSDYWENAWIIFWSLLGASFAIISTTVLRYAILLSIGLCSLLFSTFYVFSQGTWLPVAASLSAFLDVFLLISAYIYIQEKRQRNMVMDLFSRHVSQEVANQVWLQRENIFSDGRLKTQKATATILFTDLVGYTSTAEKMEPEALMEWLNNYMEIMANCVIKHGGMIDDYYGDAIKANFGVPLFKNSELLIKKDVQSAVDCALEMHQELQRMNDMRKTQGLPLIGMRMGIATGSVIVGSLGSKQRLKYTSIGDVVNIAARLESYGRKFNAENRADYCSILLAESTKDFLDDKYKTHAVGELQLKGKEHGLKAYRLMTES